METIRNLSFSASVASDRTRPASRPALRGLCRFCRVGAAFAVLASALAFGPARLDAVPLRASRILAPTSMARMARMARMSAETVPVITSVPTTQPSASSFQVTVQVDQVPAGGSSVQVTCDHPELVASPSGSWPYTLAFPDGSSTIRSFTVTSAAVSSQTSVTFGSGPSGVDMGNPSNWTSSATMTMTTANPGTDQ